MALKHEPDSRLYRGRGIVFKDGLYNKVANPEGQGQEAFRKVRGCQRREDGETRADRGEGGGLASKKLWPD